MPAREVLGGKKKKFSFPPSHQPGMRVPKGGSSCAKCEYLKDHEKGLCGNKYFIAWNGSNKIPAPIDEYCSDWFEEEEGEEEGKEDGE